MDSTQGPITILQSKRNNHLHDEEVVLDEADDLHHDLHSNLSRLSRCISNSESISKLSSSAYASSTDGDDNDDDKEMDHDADVEFSIESSDSEKEELCLSLPVTPPRRRAFPGSVAVKEYASETEAQKKCSARRRKSSEGVRERWLERRPSWDEKKKGIMDEESGESECLVITRPKGGRRFLCMDMGEVKACRDLGFELEADRTQCLFTDTSSGANSPIPSLRISSPGDDPKEVKARLKVWAQAVALATSPR